MFTIDVDSSGTPVTIDLSDMAGSTDTITGVALATELTNRINQSFGDERYFDFTGNTTFQINATVSGVNKTATIDLLDVHSFKKETLTFTAATTAGTLTVGGVAVALDGTENTPAAVAAKVETALTASTLIDGTDRSVVDNLDGTLTFNWVAADGAATDLTMVVDTTDATAASAVAKYYVKGFTEIDAVTKDVAAAAMQTLVSAAGLTTVAVAFDAVEGGFSFSEDDDGVISLQAPQSAKTYDFDGSSIASDDGLTFTLVRGTTTTTLQADDLDAAATLDDIVTAVQAQSAYATSGYTFDNVDGQLRIARNDGVTFTSAVASTGSFSGTLTDPDNSDATAVGAAASTVAASSVTSNGVLGLGTIPATVGDTGLYTPIGASLNGHVMPNGDLIRSLADQRYGLKVTFDNVNERFTFASGTTGDTSSITITDSNTLAESLFGVSAPTGTPLAVAISDTALRGTVSLPAETKGTQVAINVNNNFSVDTTNNTFVVSVDDVKGTVTLPPSDTYTLDGFMAALQKEINGLANDTGSTVSGVTVSYDRVLNAFAFTTGTTGTNSFIKVSGSTNWGLANVEAGRGSTSSWIKPTQFTEFIDGVGVSKYIDEFGEETTSADGFAELPEWSPLYLDKGELTFNTSGNLISPSTGSQLDTVYLADGKGALTINIDYSASTQYSSAFAVLSQSQDGRPEGDLVGLNIGDDGLVSASYSNGSQNTLAKVILSNFSSPAGLRQIGDSSFYATAKSGDPKIGEAGTAGFGTIRAGATERANVDLTQELVDLITAQRNFQANAKAIETSTTMTQAIIQIRT